MISKGMSDKILREAFKQQREIEDEENDERHAGQADLSTIPEVPVDDGEEDIDNFAGFSETQSQFGDYEVREWLVIITFVVVNQWDLFWSKQFLNEQFLVVLFY